MYEAMRQRAPASTRMTGLVATILATVSVGYALMNGIGSNLVRFVETPVTLISPPPADEADPAPPVEMNLETTIDLRADPLVVELPDFRVEAPPPTAATVVVQPTGGQTGPVRVAATTPVRIPPRLREESKPPYPAASIRAREEGVTGLEVCVSDRGRVTSVVIASPSGHARLDEAARRWVSDARFWPGKVDGSPQAMCGHNVIYDWKLETAGR